MVEAESVVGTEVVVEVEAVGGIEAEAEAEAGGGDVSGVLMSVESEADGFNRLEEANEPDAFKQLISPIAHSPQPQHISHHITNQSEM